MQQPTAKSRSSESPKGPPPETPPRRTQIVTGLLLLLWLLITSTADVLAPRIGEVLTTLELKYNWYTVISEGPEE